MLPAHSTILLIEDSHSQAVAFRLLLQQAGYHVLVAPTGVVGLQMAVEHQPVLIVLDIDLPVMNGFQVLARLKRERATTQIPVLMLTHREHISDVTRALELQANDYLFKEDAHHGLIGAVEQLLAGPVPASEE